jgi:hypothetical protein
MIQKYPVLERSSKQEMLDERDDADWQRERQQLQSRFQSSSNRHSS